ncbi:unnamed protein product [Oppiella nova]|uniref:G-protein coupled receptors family 1 profile domain-containing protein n=1 Tax=Oppiella nova TaxID=334625 RepID=A0A7R9LEB9_9ACAR|nr:unnamed protein product [Oppiella nova]CAG2161982.1 unnamed protein product [Oppiella nova]
MADPVWLANNNLTSVLLRDSFGSTHEIDSLDAFGPGLQAFLITLYSLTTFLAFTGNSLVILVELYGKRSARNLRKFLINLAISDILIGVLSVPFIYTDFMLGRWIFSPILCPIAQFVQLLSVFVTTYTLTAIGIERYIATLHPLSNTNTWLRSHCNLILEIGWLFGATLASVAVIHTKAVPFDFKNETYYDCRQDVGWTESDVKVYIVFSFVFTFVLPMLFITISYGAIARRLLKCPFLNTSSGVFYDKRNTEFINKMKADLLELIASVFRRLSAPPTRTSEIKATS